MATKTITQFLIDNNLGNAVPGDYFVGNRGAGNTGGILFPNVQGSLDIINVKDYGAVGNGVTDDTAAIQLALTAAGAGTYGSAIYFPSGNYLVSAALNIPTTSVGIKIYGAGRSTTTIVRKATYINGDLFYLGTIASPLLSWVQISELSIASNSLTVSGSSIHIDNRGSVLIDNVFIYQDFIGISVKAGSADVTIADSNLSLNITPIFFDQTVDETNYPNLLICGTGGYADYTSIGMIRDINRKRILELRPTTNAVNYLSISNQATTGNPVMSVFGSDTNIGVNTITKGTGSLYSLAATTTPIVWQSGTGYQHTTTFSVADTANSRVITLPDATGTVCFDTGSANITSVGTVSTGTWQATVIGMTYGGTGANLTPSNGGIIYSNASTMAVLAGTATANKMLLSGSSTTPSWSTSTISSTFTANNLLYASATNTVSGLATANNGVLVTNGSGVPFVSSTLPAIITIPTPVINGFTDASNATTGIVGQTLDSSFASSVAMTSGAATQIASLSLTAGDWELWGTFVSSPAGATTQSIIAACISTTTATVAFPSSAATASSVFLSTSTPAGVPLSIVLNSIHVKLSGTTTYYLNARSDYAISTLTGGGILLARRVR